MKFLLADDHAIVRDGVKRIIEAEFPFANFTEVATATDMLAIQSKDEHDIIISDINMPGLDGLEGVKKIKSYNKGSKVIILSMYPAAQYGVRAIKLGANGYVCKQNATDELITAIKAVSNGKRYISAELADLLAESIDTDRSKIPHENLSERELAVFKQIAAGKKISEIAEQLYISPNTVSTFRTRILKKLHCDSNAELVKYALEHQLI